ncbi:peptide chain release factor N(5)-glutamine methyltransferase [Hymenobacter armeniacus]|uniref:peptide chain release factor N(5)-glutamine methyltransferase n=1 Tax=Hymenobacter armeniacus TaxID=2771358 RepID=A0ABR8JW87_9BACT|nr:peptide chain release factor N(5)-glutamine methyltransferase [Hymenobacter armeniacus]MBD2723061.1 peptide chain release factor N(5)-glutamine methyltransferase [Hymenobacter armeniacus]
MTLRDATASLTAALTALYPESEADAIARMVLQHLLHLDGLHFMMAASQPVQPSVLAQLPALQTRLLAHEPVQYVLGTAYFAGMELEVTPATLIPRPETEELVRLIEREQGTTPGRRVLDVGTGSGCLALALARVLPVAEVLAVDISPEALAVARRNAALWAPAVAFQQVDILQDLPTGVPPGSLDVLVSNPPYVRESERTQMRDNVLAWEPATALFVPDDDPLLFYRRLTEIGHELLRPGGAIYFEINEALGQETADLLTQRGFAEVRVQEDIFGKARVVRGEK